MSVVRVGWAAAHVMRLLRLQLFGAHASKTLALVGHAMGHVRRRGRKKVWCAVVLVVLVFGMPPLQGCFSTRVTRQGARATMGGASGRLAAICATKLGLGRTSLVTRLGVGGVRLATVWQGALRSQRRAAAMARRRARRTRRSAGRAGQQARARPLAQPPAAAASRRRSGRAQASRPTSARVAPRRLRRRSGFRSRVVGGSSRQSPLAAWLNFIQVDVPYMARFIEVDVPYMACSNAYSVSLEYVRESNAMLPGVKLCVMC